MNEALKQLYIDFINEYDPYYDEPAPESLEEMLYNLQEIRENDFQDPWIDENTVYLVEFLDNIIGQFKAAGISKIDA